MKTDELRDLSFDELAEKLAEAKAGLFNLRFQLATNQLENTAELRSTKRNIARINTILREQEIAEWIAQGPGARSQGSEGSRA
ncbi:50S ribosomal protein L29 [soil metagenome]